MYGLHLHPWWDVGASTHNTVRSLWQPVAILSGLEDFFKQQDKWPHEGTNSLWEEEQGSRIKAYFRY